MNRYLRDVNDSFFLPEALFRQHYRLSREAARDVFFQIQEHLENGQRVTKIPAIRKFTTALHFFAHGSYQKAVGISQHSGLSQTSVSNSFHEVIHVMVRYLGNAYIKFPQTLEGIVEVKRIF
jgi:hypothetical protein